MRDTTERPEGVAAGTAILTGPNARPSSPTPRGLLTDEAAYRSMATAKNPYGDGHAAERIVERIRRYFASEDVRAASMPSGSVDPKQPGEGTTARAPTRAVAVAVN